MRATAWVFVGAIVSARTIIAKTIIVYPNTSPCPNISSIKHLE